MVLLEILKTLVMMMMIIAMVMVVALRSLPVVKGTTQSSKPLGKSLVKLFAI